MATEPERQVPRRNPINRALGGWQSAAVVMAANKLDFFTAVGEEAITAEEVACRCDTHPRPTRVLLSACVALGILEKDGEVYRNSTKALQTLVRGKPTFMGDGIAHQHDLWQAWGRLHEAVRSNQRVGGRYNLTEGSEVHRNFILAMHDRARQDAPLLAEALDLTGRHQLFDAGGGPGTYSIFLVKRYPGLRAIVFDLPQTIEIAKDVIVEFDMSELITTRAGDYFEDDFGQGNDVVLLSAIFHSMSPERSKGLLFKAYNSLVASGEVVVHEGLIDDGGTAPMRAVMFSLNMLVNTGEGQSYSGSEIMGLMEDVGFTNPRVVHLPEPARTSLVIATKS
jgi:hypothetical protein